jgi:hypothetical protein
MEAYVRYTVEDDAFAFHVRNAKRHTVRGAARWIKVGDVLNAIDARLFMRLIIPCGVYHFAGDE